MIFFNNYFQGLVSNNSLSKRLGLENVHELPQVDKDHKVWDVAAFYLAQLCLNVTLLVSPEVIILGGGIMNQPKMLPAVHQHFTKLLNSYIKHSKLESILIFVIKVLMYFKESKTTLNFLLWEWMQVFWEVLCFVKKIKLIS